MGKINLCRKPPALRDLWPLARLALVLILFGLWARWKFDLTAASLPAMEKGMAGMLGILVLCGVISATVMELYIAVVVFPFYATTVLNEWLYGACYWTFRTLLRILYMRRVSALVALLGELGLFLGVWQMIEILMRRYCF